MQTLSIPKISLLISIALLAGIDIHTFLIFLNAMSLLTETP
ncbi:hypothetical protein HY11_16830 [Hyphomonas pacifica]|nr:hypothetical protein HY11_16830 [Hyphomonas pacifica]